MKTIKEINKKYESFLGEKIDVSGWVRTVRVSKDFGFIELNDGTFFKNLQIVFDNNLSNFSEIERIAIGSGLEITGELVKSPAKGQEFELKAESIKIAGPSSEDYPLQKKRHSFEFLRTIAHLRGRSNTFSAVFRLRSVLSFAIHRFFQEKGFVYVHTPIISTSDCEGAGEMFHVTTFDLDKVPVNDKGEVDFEKDFFGEKAGLTVSGQLNGEAMAMAFNKIYTLGPTFRAENS
ncbi:asparagine--tRNA ligase, partial [Candidatus Falkowbacteria bacterium]|nr:asparagine--tRNA ligase [Candidatus Falkowbacteria bacterium]